MNIIVSTNVETEWVLNLFIIVYHCVKVMFSYLSVCLFVCLSGVSSLHRVSSFCPVPTVPIIQTPQTPLPWSCPLTTQGTTPTPPDTGPGPPHHTGTYHSVFALPPHHTGTTSPNLLNLGLYHIRTPTPAPIEPAGENIQILKLT